MIRIIIQKAGESKNPNFKLDPSISNTVLFSWLFEKSISLIRGYRLLLVARNPRRLMLGARVRIRGMKQLRLGKGVQIAHDVNIQAWGREGLSIGDYSWIGAFSFLKVSFSLNEPGHFIRIGNRVGLGEFAHLGGAGGLTIGDDCIIGPYLSCHPENHCFESDTELIRLQGTRRKGIHIGKNCWIGAKVTVLDGVRIGDNCVIAAGAVITKDMPSNSIIGGVPAKVLRSRLADSKISAA